MDEQGSPPKRNVAIFLDMENLFGGYQGDVTSVPIGSIVREIEKVTSDRGVGSLTALVRAYANWGRSDMAVYRRELLENGVEPVQIFSFNQNVKNAADIELVVDALEVAAESPWVDVFVIVSGDGGFVPLIRRLHVLGKYVLVVTTSHFAAGGVSKLLQSVADYFHVIPVPDGNSIASGATSTYVSAGKPALSSVSSAAIPGPTLEEYKKAIKDLVRDEQSILVNGAVDGSRLGPRLRKRWPATDYRAFGYQTLGSFVEEQCGLSMFRPNIMKINGAIEPAKIAAGVYPISVKNRNDFIVAIRNLFSEGNQFHQEVLSADGSGLPLSVIELRLPSLVTSRTYADLGYPDLRTMLQHALDPTELRVAPTPSGDVVMLEIELAGGVAYSPISDHDLSNPDLVRTVLGSVDPRVTYPEPMVLSLVLSALPPASQPWEVADLIEFIADQLPEVSAEEIRFSLGLLWEVGVLVSEGSHDEGQLSVKTYEDIVEEGLRIVAADALKRAEEVEWPVDEESIDYIIY